MRGDIGIAALVASAALGSTACEESFDHGPSGDGGATSTTTAGPATGPGEGGGVQDVGVALDVPVPSTGRVLVDLETATIASEADAWDIAFEGVDVLTNGGLSGPGAGAAFGPYAATQILFDERPEVPFVIEDHAGGAFLDWYLYDGTTHALWSRYHVVGVQRGDARYKVQILGYYGEVDSAPVSALYHLRYAEVGAAGSSTTSIVEGLDGTAGGTGPDDAAPSGCLRLVDGTVTALGPAEAQASEAWDLCFRRDVITVNGERGGPGGVVAVNLDAGAIAGESLEDVAARTPDGEAARFDAVDAARLDDPALVWRGDRVISAFSDAWLETRDGALAPVAATWLVVGADGAEHLVAFEALTGATATSVGTVRLRTRPVRP